MNTRGPGPHALNIARAVQEEIAPAMVILFGSRATGKHYEHSDVDLLVVTQEDNHPSARIRASLAAKDYLKANPPRLEVNVISMTRHYFNCCRRANQHVAGQAAHYGVIMNGERLDYQSSYEDDYPTHWPETRQRIQKAEEYNHHFNEVVGETHWHQEMIGFMAQQAIENAIKGWLSTYNDNRTYGHDLTELWEDVAKMEDWSNPELDRLYKSMSELFNHIKYEDPNRPSKQCDWLTNYSVIYCYAGTSHHMNQNERLELREKVNNAVASMIERIHDKSGTTDSDVYPEGIKPWEVTP